MKIAQYFFIIAFVLFYQANTKAEKVSHSQLTFDQTIFFEENSEIFGDDTNANKPVKDSKVKHVINLEEAINIALASNRSIHSQADSLRGSKFNLDSAVTEFQYKITPDSGLGATGSKDVGQTHYRLGASVHKKFTHGTEVIINPTFQKAVSEDSDYNYNSGIDFSIVQPLFRGLNQEYNLSGIRGAEYSVRSAYRNLHQTKVNTIIQTVTAVYEIIRQKRFVTILQKSVLRLKGFAETARIKKEIGIADAVNVYRANQNYKQSRDDLLSAEEALTNAQENLKIILNLPIEEEFDVRAPLTIRKINISEPDAVKTAFENRTELKEMKDLLREKYRLSRIAKHKTLPELNFIVSYNRFGSGASFGQSTTLGEDRWNIGVGSSTDLFRRTEKIAFQQSLLSIASIKRESELIKDQIVKQVKNDLRNLIRYKKRIALQNARAQEARRQLELSRIKFKHGFANNFDLIDAEKVLNSAQINTISAIISHIVGTFKFRATIGALLEKPERNQ